MDGIYVVDKAPVFPNEPDPELVQLAPAANCNEPFKGIEATLFLQSVRLLPASTIGDLKIFNAMVSFFGVQLPVEVRMNLI